MFGALWHNLVFRPLYNFLIYLYEFHTNYNMGYAVVYLTVLLRLVLLPFSIITEQGKEFYRRIHTKIDEARRDFAGDAVGQRRVIRELLRKNKIRPWSRLVVLVFHVLVLIALYQTFVGGLTTAKLAGNLYPSLRGPDFINTNLFCTNLLPAGYCLDIAHRSAWFAAIVAVVLFLEITLDQRGQKGKLTRPEIVYRIMFPAFTFVALALLPSVKSVFILTSLLFSIIISLSGSLFFGTSARKAKAKKRQLAAAAAQPDPFSNQLYGR